METIEMTLLGSLFGKILKKWSWDAGERKGCGIKSSLVWMGDTRTCPYTYILTLIGSRRLEMEKGQIDE